MCCNGNKKDRQFSLSDVKQSPTGQGARCLAGALGCIVYLLNAGQVDALTHSDGFAHQSADSPRDRSLIDVLVPQHLPQVLGQEEPRHRTRVRRKWPHHYLLFLRQA
jgi:hypothetical protein